MQLTLYHGTTEHDAISILDAQHIEPSAGEKHYLGTGAYLYEDPFQAGVWARMKSSELTKRSGVEQKPFVLAVSVQFHDDVYMNLDMRRDQEVFFYQRKMYHHNIQLNRLGIEYYNDSRFCDFVCDMLSLTVMSKTFSYVHKRYGQIHAVASNYKLTDRNITRHHWTEKQFCVKDKDLITNITPWEVSDDE